MPGSLLQQIHDQGVSPWLDGVTRDELRSGFLQVLISNFGVSGVTTNPRLFAKSLAGSAATYEGELRDMATRGVGTGETARHLIAQDARDTCDALSSVHQESGGYDGWVSLDIDPRFADDAEATLADVRALTWSVDRPNLMVKVPATVAGVSAIAAATAEGYNVNATLIASVERYRDVLDAYALGLERAGKARIKLSTIHSVASLFVSRVDIALAALRSDHTRSNTSSLASQAGIVNARYAHRALSEAMRTSSWRRLVAAGANPQRLLWAPTGVNDPRIDETAYLEGLALPGTISAMALETLASAAQAPSRPTSAGAVVSDIADEIRARKELDAVGDELMPRLLADGVARAQKSWRVALNIVDERLDAARAGVDKGDSVVPIASKTATS